MSQDDAKKLIQGYLTLVKAQRDKYAAQFPGRYYTIGLYSNGVVAAWAYEQGIVSEFWQSASSGSTGNTPPNRAIEPGDLWRRAILRVQSTPLNCNPELKRLRHIFAPC